MATTGTVIGSRPTLTQPVPGGVIIGTADNSHDPVQVTCEQTAPAVIRPPRPRWSTTDRPGKIGIPSWDGQDPYEIVLSIRLDGYPNESIEPSIAILEGFAEVPPGAGQPAILELDGAIPRPRPHLKWRLTAIDDPSEQIYLPDGKRRCRYVTSLTLTQHVAPDSLEESLKQTSASTGLRTRTTTVRPGESDLYAVARRYYNDPSRASDIARANFKNGRQLSLGAKLTAGTQLRMPS